MTLEKLVDWMDEELRINEIPDYSAALNGLQFENNGEIGKVVAAVDASLPVIQKAVNAGADLLLVHHGLFWQGAQQVRGAIYKKYKLALENNLAIYSAHIPLDIHPYLGNNAQLAQSISMAETESFFDWKGVNLGLKQSLNLTRDELVKKVENAVSAPVHICPGGSDVVGEVGIITGGAGSEVAAIAESGIETFITGEGPHWSYPLAEELGINIIYAGHYATETFGVKALAYAISEKYGVEWSFLDHPTGL